ncbi:hypothetical protein LTSEMON_2940 [Salmonella enterica subsp. enterica serovar Montevideo str. S5-403]|uniref:Uncharacterized protein n=1 Tax=Salmonella enterica subsp. enterica serovar Montevideo str. S5-403 TaxID=913242 RepID=G5Q4E7_SALMO|nr:hypothetical protein LTSEMON_2940 [Salmonella enterica subsp. enterica serovar Montevideo str. S5-403]
MDFFTTVQIDRAATRLLLAIDLFLTDPALEKTQRWISLSSSLPNFSASVGQTDTHAGDWPAANRVSAQKLHLSATPVCGFK